MGIERRKSAKQRKTENPALMVLSSYTFRFDSARELLFSGDINF